MVCYRGVLFILFFCYVSFIKFFWFDGFEFCIMSLVV